MKVKCPTRFTTGILLVLWLLIGVSGCSPSLVDVPPLHEAVRDGSRARVSNLIAAGADVTARSDGTGSTPLHFAVLFRGLSAEDIVSSLIEAGADVNAISDYGSTPLDSAVAKGYDLVADTLIEAGGRSGQHY